MITTDNKGNIFLEFIKVPESELEHIELDAPLTHALIVAKHNNKTLLMFNKWSKSWTLPGGVIEAGETPSECAVREMYEETGQKAEQVRFAGLMKFDLQPDFHGPHRVEYGALFAGVVENPTEFVKNDEAEKIVFWDGTEDIGAFELVDRKLSEFA